MAGVTHKFERGDRGGDLCLARNRALRLVRGIATVWSCVLGLVLVYAGIAKSLAPQEPTRALSAWLHAVGLAGPDSSVILIVVVCIEIGVGAWCVSGIAPRPALLSMACILTTFTVWTWSAHELLGTNDCGCGLPKWLGRDFAHAIARNSTFVVLSLGAALGVREDNRRVSHDD